MKNYNMSRKSGLPVVISGDWFSEAVAKSLNSTGYIITQKVMPQVLEMVFDRPTPWVKRGFEYIKADSTKLTLRIRAKEEAGKGNPAYKILQAQVYGGARAAKRFEKRLRYAGILSNNEFVVPGKYAKLDRYGNQSPGQIIQILSALGAFDETGYLMNRSVRNPRNKKPLQIFVARRGDKATKHLSPGIYERKGRKIRQLMKFVRQPQYKIRLEFEDIVQQSFNQIFQKELAYRLRI